MIILVNDSGPHYFVVTKTKGHFIINTSYASLDGNVVSFRNDAAVQEFETQEELEAAHRAQFPKQYKDED